MQASVDSLDHKLKSPDNTMITSTDSLEPNTPRTADKMTISTDSIENGKSTDPMTVSIDSLDGNGKDMFSDKTKEFPHEIQGAASMLFTSTDSIESCSTNTRATASMLSSITSQGSETLVADDELEYDDEESKSAMKYLINQGNIHFEDSDDVESVADALKCLCLETFAEKFQAQERLMYLSKPLLKLELFLQVFTYLVLQSTL